MDFQKFADGFHTLTYIVSVEKTETGYGEIRIVAGNAAFAESVLHPKEYCVPRVMKNAFTPNCLYTDFMERSTNFEDLCFRAAVQKESIHTFIHPANSQTWLNIIAMPVAAEDGSLCYCTYTLQPTAVSGINMLSAGFVETSADILKTCIKLHDTADFKMTMKEVIKDIRVICDAAVCTLMLVDTTSGTCSVLATDIKPGSILKRVTQFVNFYDIAMSWVKTIGDSNCLIIQNEQDMQYISEVNNPWYLTLEEAGVDSVVLFPLRYNNELLGFIWATNFDTRYTMRIKETLELTTFFISSEVAGYQMLQKLRHISFTDLLTGVRNRNAMNSRVSNIIAGDEELHAPFGIIFADLNGLKLVNDNGGHSAGDLLLKKAAVLLQEVCSGDEIYRAGGDEFMIIVSGCKETEFQKKAERLSRESQDPENVCFAVGVHWAETDTDIRDAMRLADENMYHNKKMYYFQHPERKHR
ncbi:MAG: GGDEF domain-containing protein [Oscillospiraceae bacterium]|nr:GGDEF domain-containing protein [Oscillospiraceae bacterium]